MLTVRFARSFTLLPPEPTLWTGVPSRHGRDILLFSPIVIAPQRALGLEADEPDHG